MDVGEPVCVPIPEVPEGPPPRELRVTFGQEWLRCGDEVALRAFTEGIDDGEEVTFDIGQDGTSVASESATLAGGAASATWITRCRTDDRPEPPFELLGHCAGEDAEGDGPLEVMKYEDISRQTRTIPCRSGRFGWTGKFDVELTDGEVVVTTKIKLLNRQGERPPRGDPLPDVGDPVSDATKRSMKSDIEGKLSGKHYLHRDDCARGDECDCPKERGCCWLRVRVVVEFVESGEHHEVNLWRGRGRATSSNWTRVKTRANSYAHETGHLLAWYDEYASGAVGSAPRWRVQSGVVMATGLDVPAEYYWDFRDWIGGRTAEDWDLIEV